MSTTDRLQILKDHLPIDTFLSESPSHPPKMSAGESKPQEAQLKHDAESAVKRNPHGDFSEVQASRPDWDESRSWQFTKTLNPTWTYGSGSNTKSDKAHISIDPYAEDRQPVQNYKLLISGIIPRPIGFISTRAKDGTSTNLSPFSYTQVVNHVSSFQNNCRVDPHFSVSLFCRHICRRLTTRRIRRSSAWVSQVGWTMRRIR